MRTVQRQDNCASSEIVRMQVVQKLCISVMFCLNVIIKKFVIIIIIMIIYY